MTTRDPGSAVEERPTPAATATESAGEKNTILAHRRSAIPQHLGIVLDGNRRWARSHGLTTAEGHRQGLAKAPEVLTWCEEAGLKIVTLWLLSTDNLQRREDELRPLFDSLTSTGDGVAAVGRWKVRHIGRADILTLRLKDALASAEESSADNSGMTVNLAIGYGGRDEIIRAVHRLITHNHNNGPLPAVASMDELTALLGSLVDTAGQPDPELIIRTSGEYRTSGF